MSFKNLKNAVRRYFSQTVDDKYPSDTNAAMVVGNLCSGIPLSGVVPSLVSYPEPEEKMVVDGHLIKGDKYAIGYVDSMLTERVIAEDKINCLRNDNKNLQEEIQRLKMDNAKLYETLSTARSILVDTLQGQGIIETRIAQYVDWYERVRDSRNSPKQDLYPYRMCKSIVDIESQMLKLQDEHTASQGVQTT